MPSERGKGVTVDKTWNVPFSRILDQPRGGVLPYITYMGMCRPTGS